MDFKDAAYICSPDITDPTRHADAMLDYEDYLKAARQKRAESIYQKLITDPATVSEAITEMEDEKLMAMVNADPFTAGLTLREQVKTYIWNLAWDAAE